MNGWIELLRGWLEVFTAPPALTCLLLMPLEDEDKGEDEDEDDGRQA
jgi:hypothetical protein